MIALDTNVIVYALTGIAEVSARATRALEHAASRGELLIASAPVYAELLAIPKVSEQDITEFLLDTKIRVDFDLTHDCWTQAGLAFAAYARRRKRQKNDQPRRILADFVIGAHALGAGRLLTADVSFYRTNYPALTIQPLDAVD